MKIHEYQGKALLAKYGVPVPMGIPAFSIDEAEHAVLPQQLLALVLVDLHSFFEASMSSRTAPADFSSMAFSSAVSWIETIFSTPAAPMTTGTPM